MKTRLTALFVLLVLAVGVLAACGGSDDGLVGRWESDYEGDYSWYVFNEDGTGTRDVFGFTEDFTWEVVARNVVLSLTGRDEVWGFTIRRNTVAFTSDLMPGVEFRYSRAR